MRGRYPDAVTSEVVAGALLLRSGPFAATAVLLLVVLGAPLVALGGWRPLPGLAMVGLALLFAGWVVRWVPVRPVPVWACGLVLVAALGHTAWAVATHAEHIVVRRDAGSYAQFAHHLASRGGLPVDPSFASLGGAAARADPSVTVGAPGFYADGADVVPQFLLGAPLSFSVGHWVGGWTGLLVVPAVAGGLAVVAVAGLAARTVGPRWAAAVAAAVSVTQPVLHATRSTYSEPWALLVTASALAVMVDACVTTDRAGGWAGSVRALDDDLPGRLARARRLGLIAGLLLAGGGLLRVDTLREVVVAVPVVALLAVRHHPVAWPLAAGLAAGALTSAVVAVGLSRPYLEDVAGSLLPLLLLGTVLGAACTLLAVPVAVRGVGRVLRLLATRPVVVPGLVLLAAAALLTRPWWLVSRADQGDVSDFVGRLQVGEGLARDPLRTYAEQSATWVSWWLGWPAVTLAAVAAAVLAGRAVGVGAAGEMVPSWLPALLVAGASAVLVLLRPGITPDHPWADRRLVVTVLPTVLVLAAAALAHMVRRLARRRPASVLVAGAGVGVLVLVGPAAWGSYPVAGERTERGELDAVERACAAFRGGDVALAVDDRARNEWVQVIRGICGIPAAAVLGTGDDLADAAIRVAARSRAAGSRPVLVSAGSPNPLLAVGAVPRQVVRLDTTEDPRLLLGPGGGAVPLDVDLWVAAAP